MQINKILVATDFSPGSKAALSHAHALAERHDAELHLLHVHVAQADWSGWEARAHLVEVDEVMEGAAKENMQALLEKQDDKVVHSLLRAKRAAPAIARYAQEQAIDLIVIGSRTKGGTGNVFLGSVAGEVARTSPCSTLVVPAGTRSAQPYTPRKIVVGLDLTARSAELLEAAAELAETNDAKLHVLHVIESADLPMYFVGEFVGDQRAAAQKALKKLLVQAGVADKVTSQVLVGATHEQVNAYADKVKADLIVTGRARLSRLGRLMLGSTTRRVLRRAPCPVLTWQAERSDENSQD